MKLIGNRPAISYRRAGGSGDCKFAINNAEDGSGTWYISNVQTTDVVGQFTSLVSLANGQPGISFYDTTNTALRWAYGESWTDVTSDSWLATNNGAGSGDVSSLSFDTTGTFLGIGSSNGTTTTYADAYERTGADWTTRTNRFAQSDATRAIWCFVRLSYDGNYLVWARQDSNTSSQQGQATIHLKTTNYATTPQKTIVYSDTHDWAESATRYNLLWMAGELPGSRFRDTRARVTLGRPAGLMNLGWRRCYFMREHFDKVCDVGSLPEPYSRWWNEHKACAYADEMQLEQIDIVKRGCPRSNWADCLGP